MCDTLVALPDYTQTGSLIFGKNSDREPLEAQSICYVPRTFAQQKTVQCTFIQIPEIAENHAVFLSKPFQMWGAEMGANEYGLVIGNEAVFTNVKIEKKNTGLTGMDLLRLALQRTKKAKEALECILDLLSIYGQNACGGYQNKNFFYHNSFIIADPTEAFVLETAGKSWTYKRVKENSSISNALSIEENHDAIHLENEPRTFQGIWRREGNNFKHNFSDLLYTSIAKGAKRQSRTLTNILATGGKSMPQTFFDTLRTHNIPHERFSPHKANTESICMHATGLINPSDTTGSMVAEIRKNQVHTIWFSATSHPCMSIYLPFFFGDQNLPRIFSPSASPDQSLWWRAYQLHQWIAEDYQKRKPIIRAELDQMQNTWIEKEKKLIELPAIHSELIHFSQQCSVQYTQWLDKKLALEIKKN